MIHLDTSFLIRAGVTGSTEAQRLRRWLTRREPVKLSAIVWAELLCGPISEVAIEAAADVFGEPLPLTGANATFAAILFNGSGRRRGTLADCMIAATAIDAGATLATSNAADFQRFTSFGLRLSLGRA